MAYEAEIKLLAERDAIRVSYRANRQDKTVELVRQWQTSKADLQSSALTFLNTYGSVKNYNDETPVAAVYVTDPLADQKTYPGTWRVVFNDATRKLTNPEEQGIYQTLRLGWVKSAESLPTAVLLDDAKTLLSPFVHDTTSQKRRYIYEYRYIDPDYAATLRDTISLTAGVIEARVVKQEEGYCNIHVLTETNTWTGDLTQIWEYQNINPTFAANKLIDTYTHIPTANLSTYKTTLGTPTAGYKVSSIVDTTNAEGGFCSITRTQEKLFASGGSTTVTADNGTLKADEYLTLITDGVVRTTTWIGVADADLATAMATVSSAPIGYRIVRVSNNYDGTGSFDLIREMMNTVTPASALMAVQWPTFDDERRTYYYFGLTKAQADAQLVTSQTVCDAGYKVDSVQVQEWKFNTLIVVQQISKLISSVAEGTGKTIAYDYEWWGDSEIVTKKWLNIEEADLETALTTLSTPPSGYTTVGISHEYDGTGKANLTRVCMKQVTSAFEAAIYFPAFMGERVVNYYLGLDATEAGTLYTSCQTSPSASYKVDSVEQREGDRGTITVIQSLSKLNTALTSQERTADYSRIFGLTTFGTRILLNIAKASIVSTKAAILADATITVLNIQDDDIGQGMANITYTYRSVPSAARSMGAMRVSKPTAFHQTVEDRQWIDISVSDADSVKDAVAAALAGTGSYALASNEQVVDAFGEDLGDKTARITQRVAKPDGTYADSTAEEAINPHGLQMANLVTSIREYPEVYYANVGTVYALLQNFITTGGNRKGRIQVSLNTGTGGSFAMRGLKETAPTWANTTPDYVQVGVGLEDLIGETKTDLATGVPVASAAAIVDATTADADHVLESVTMREMGQGEAHIEKRQAKKYETQVQVSEIEGLGWRRPEKNYTWPLVHPDNVATVWTTALTYGIAGDYVLVFRQKDILGNGMYRITSNTVECTAKSTSWTGYDSNGIAIVTTKYQDAASIVNAAKSSGIVQRVDGGMNQFNKYDYTLDATTATKTDTGWVSFNDLWGTSYTREIVHGSTVDRDAVIADFVAGDSNSLSVSDEPYGLLTIRASRQASGLYRDTYFGQADDYKEWETVKREYRNTSSDPGGYVWRDITIHMRRYVGITYQGGPALHGAWANLENPPAGYEAEADSVEPRYVGRKGGWAYYESILVYREFSATWNASSTDSNP